MQKYFTLRGSDQDKQAILQAQKGKGELKAKTSLVPNAGFNPSRGKQHSRQSNNDNLMRITARTSEKATGLVISSSRTEKAIGT